MANQEPMTVNDLLDSIHVAYEQAQPSDGPSLSDDDGVIRLNLINKAIRRWEFDNDVRWRELYVYNVTGPTILAGVTSYPLTQTDFREFAGRLRLLRTDGAYAKVDLISPELFAKYVTTASTTKACITGNPSSGYTLHLLWSPATNDGTIGGTILFDYYKYAKKMAVPADIPEMSNPQFIVDYVVGELFVNDDVNLYTKFNGDALNALSNMRTANDATPPYASNTLENQGYADGIVMGL